MKIGIITPSIRDLSFLDTWPIIEGGQGKLAVSIPELEVHAYIIYDKPLTTAELDEIDPRLEALVGKGYKRAVVYDHNYIDYHYPEIAKIIPRQTDCIRSFGYWRAYQDGMDAIYTVDDDCIWTMDTLRGHVANLTNSYLIPEWRGIVRHQRGIPFSCRKFAPRITGVTNAVSIGEWSGVPDYDGPTQLVLGGLSEAGMATEDSVAKELMDATAPKRVAGMIAGVGVFPPMCGMSLAFTRGLVPAMYFLLMGKAYPYDRFGDIWAGMFAKRVCDHLGYPFVLGGAPVVHKRASNPWVNMRKELAALEAHEGFWEEVYRLVINGETVAECYADLARKLDSKYLDPEYLQQLKEAMLSWVGLFEEEGESNLT